ncbi:MAG TPA: 30S ribosomal protein S16 [Polyangiaceae bacterium]|nr:30S ribosomal protein S16 [Polyangiaceae bacterium]
MAVHIRLARHGSKKHPHYRVVVTDHRSPRDGSFIESIGTYDPAVDPGALKVDGARLAHWTQRGARPSHTLARLLKRQPAAAPSGA